MPAAKSHSLPNFRHFLSHHSKVWAQLVPFIGLNIHSNLLWLTRDRGEVGGWVAMSCHLLLTLSPPEWLCIKVGSCARPFNVSLIVWAKSQGSVHKPQFLKTTESRSGSNRGRSAYQPSALLLGHTGSLKKIMSPVVYIPSISGTLGHAGVYWHTSEPIFIWDRTSSLGLGTGSTYKHTYTHNYILASVWVVVIWNRMRPRALV